MSRISTFENAVIEQPINKVCLLLVCNGHLILLVRKHAADNSVSIEPPGGKIDRKLCGEIETPQEALIREAQEELGIRISPGHLMALENHPYTGKPVAYYSCEHVEGNPYNKADGEHLGILALDIQKISSYEDLEAMALAKAQEITEVSLIEFRVPKEAVMSHIEEPAMSRRQIAEENLGASPNPA